MRVVIAEYDREWPHVFAREAARLRAVLGSRALLLQHVGSTSVPGLPAKPIIDMLLVVADSSDEPAYAPDLLEAGYVLKIREPAWYEHRLFTGPGADINLHVLSEGCEEIDRMLRFRDWLRSHPGDREHYLKTKRALAAQEWQLTQEYADAKTEVVRQILGRAQSESPAP